MTLDEWLRANKYLTKQEFLDCPLLVEEFKKDNGKTLDTPEQALHNYILNIGGAMMMGLH